MRIHVVAAPGYKVRNPETNYTHLPPEGAWVVFDEYWSRHLRDGVVIRDDDGDPLE